MKFSLKSILRGIISGAIADVLISVPGAWWQWKQAQAMVRGDAAPDWGQYFDILLTWVGPVFLVAAPLAILFHAWRNRRNESSK